MCGAGGLDIYKYCDIAASLAACLVSLYCAVAGLAGGAFGVVSQYLAHNGQSATRIAGRVAAGGVSARVGVSFVAGGGGISTPPHPQNQHAKSWLPFQKFFLKFYFFIFSVRLLLAFSCRMPKNRLFSYCCSCDWL